mgnify:CR=1 FL=1
MKPNKIKQQLVLNKTTVARLDTGYMENIRGGSDTVLDAACPGRPSVYNSCNNELPDLIDNYNKSISFCPVLGTGEPSCVLHGGSK